MVVDASDVKCVLVCVAAGELDDRVVDELAKKAEHM
jgi:hypothetical protein